MTSLTIGYIPASNQGLSYRGTETWLYNLAHHSETILGNKSIICLNKKAYNDPLVLKKFEKRFPCIVRYDNTEDLETQLLAKGAHAVYKICYGKKDEPFPTRLPLLVHCVYSMEEKHGLVYMAISSSVAEKFDSTLYLPHMVYIDSSEEHYRTKLGIPESAIVFGRSGGSDTFDLEIAKSVIMRILQEKENIYFLFAVRPLILKDIAHPRLICLEPFADLKVTRKFINTCDAMLHAQSLGETFGLAVGEFSTANKPVITWSGPARCEEHLRILKDKCIKYSSTDELYKILTTFDPIEMRKKNWKAYTDYTPEKIMAQFDHLFLDPVRKHLLCKQNN